MQPTNQTANQQTKKPTNQPRYFVLIQLKEVHFLFKFYVKEKKINKQKKM